MNKIKSFFRTYNAFTRAGVQDSLAYRVYFMGYFVAHCLYCFIMYFIWKTVFGASSSDTFNGFNLMDMTVYLFITQAVSFFVDTDSATNLSEEIKTGNIAMRLIKPINVDMSILFYEIGNKAVFVFTSFIPIVVGVEIYKYIMLGHAAFNVLAFLWFVVSMLLSYALSFYFNLIFGYLAFFLRNLWGTSILKTSIINFFSGKIIPLAFFPAAVATVFGYLPFSSLLYTPVMIYLGKYTGNVMLKAMGLQVFWLLVFYLLSKMVWKFAMKHLTLQGG